MLKLTDQISNFPIEITPKIDTSPWLLVMDLKNVIKSLVKKLGSEFRVENGIAIHHNAKVETGVTFKGPIIINANCKIGANSYLREGVFIGQGVKIGPSSEIKGSIICGQSSIAHLNYIGNSIIGNDVNFEAGSIAANHYNEREDKTIKVIYEGTIQETGLVKLGAIVGDNSKIGANAVLSPGTILQRKSIVKRLELVEQII